MENTEAAKNTTTSGFASPLFSFSNPGSASFGFGFDSGAPPPPPPPAVEVQLSEESPVASASLDPVVVDDSLTIYKGRVSTSDVFGVKDSDLVPGKYEGGLKLWEGSLDLVKALNSDIKEGRLLLESKRVLELGCGHGLPGIFAGLKVLLFILSFLAFEIIPHIVGVPTRGPGSQLVNAACFLVPDDDARGNTVTHGLSWFRPRGRTSSKGGVRGHCIILHPECL